MSLTKAEIAARVSVDVGVQQLYAKQVVDGFFEIMRSSLSDGKSLKVSGFGNFILRDKTARPGRNPKTGESIRISARTVLTFKPSKQLLASTDQDTNEDTPDS